MISRLDELKLTSVLAQVVTDFNKLSEMTVHLRVAAGSYVMIVGILGMLVNGKVFFMLRKSTYKTAFHYFCRARAVFNCCTLVGVVFWSGPVTLLNRYYFSYTFNAWIGQFSAQLSFSMGPMLAFCMTINRFFAAYLPLQFMSTTKTTSNYMKLGATAVCFSLAFALFLYGLVKEKCAYIYSLETLSWYCESDCAIEASTVMLYGILLITTAATVINFLTFIKLYMNMRVAQDASMISRTRGHYRMLFQNFIQDVLYVVDMLLGLYGYTWNDALWFQFLLNSAVWMTHVSIDGFVMYWYNRPRNETSPIVSSMRRNNTSTTHAQARNPHIT